MIQLLPRVFALAALITCLAVQAAWAAPRQRVLLLHSYHQGLNWTDGVDAGIRSVLAGLPGVELYTEYLDAKRLHAPEDAPALAGRLQAKYARVPMDVVVASDDDAFQFLLGWRAKVFPGARVVFCGVNFFDEAMLGAEKDHVTGVVEDFDVRGTLRAALSMLPSTYRVVVVNDRSSTGLANAKALAEVMPEFEKKVAVATLDDLTMDELLDRVEALSQGDLILLMTFNRDRAGRTFDYDESIALIASRAKAPMFGVWDFYLGHGIVGGLLTSGFNQGEVAGRMAQRLLAGESVADVPVRKQSPHRYMFDYAQLRRFAIPLSALPEGSEVVNRPASFYDEHQGKVLSVAAAFLVLLGMVMALWVNIQGRKKTEASLRESEEKFERIFRHSPDWIAILRLNGGIYLDVNEAFEKVTGFSRAEVLGRTSMDIGIYANPDQRYELDDEFLRTGSTQNQELQYRTKSGEVITVERSGELVEIGGERCIVSIVRDITQKRQAEQALLESERQKKLRTEAEIKMLQAQINPHFLFNAITSIMHYIRTDPDTASDLLVKLGDFFRKNIKPGGSSIPLAKELEHCEDYLSIERARFEERLRVSYAVDPAVLECPVPPLILQPLVENALRHGLMPKEEGGEIRIEAAAVEGGVRICVRDDGVGMDQADAEPLLAGDVSRARPKGSGLALGNVQARLVGIHGVGHGLCIETAPGRGFTVCFTIPRP
ncbi:Sensor histidine kinase YpdA [Fundidesulfovibrio magnetotacticus]|uniref:Sensor histidine kinase YpdA n=1 Tax=Fundidesulfovibrio magnetotacticus TaxID=2730080 RepID=A0A6V8LRC5_9BACT|nr:histidine kinase [Fundidesulfovibrio magnetotacticus]GFK95042.1 Sensor histidine kinase YpdA [Fundidesulfovibrio magnetotacticus]